MSRETVVLLLLSCLCSACRTRQATEPGPDSLIRLPLAKQTEVTPGDLTAAYRYVALGQTRKPVGAIDQLIVTDDRIIIADKEQAQAIFIFDHDGTSCAEIYGLGRGPQEYGHIDHVSLTSDAKPQLAILDGTGDKVLFYDMDGRFVGSTATPFHINGMEYLNQNELLCYANASIRHDPYFKGRKDADRLLFFTDKAFRIEASALPNRVKNREISYTEPFVKRSGDELLVNPNMNDTIYRLDGRDLKPLYYVDLTALGQVQPTEELTDDQIINLRKKSPVFGGFFTPGKNFLFMDVSTPQKQSLDRYVYSKSSGKINLLKCDTPRSGDAALADVAFNGIRFSWKDRFIAQIPAYVVPMVYRNGTDNPVLKNIGEDNNPVLVFYLLKEPGT